ncbi:MAG: response regulator [Verrucomicrobiota bacterium]
MQSCAQTQSKPLDILLAVNKREHADSILSSLNRLKCQVTIVSTAEAERPVFRERYDLFLYEEGVGEAELKDLPSLAEVRLKIPLVYRGKGDPVPNVLGLEVRLREFVSLGRDLDGNGRRQEEANMVLLVEEDPVLRQVLTKVLIAHSFIVGSVASPSDAFNEFHRGIATGSPFDVVILDHDFGISSYELLSDIKRFDSEIPVIGTTAMADPDLYEDTSDCGYSGVIAKPCSVQRFVQVIREMVYLRKMAADRRLASV